MRNITPSDHPTEQQRRQSADAQSSLPLIALVIKLDRLIDRERPCCDNVAVIGSDAKHNASLVCAACGSHRGWLSTPAITFILETLQRFGRPTEPIVLRSSFAPEPTNTGGQALQPWHGTQTKDQYEAKGNRMDMKKYAGGQFIKVDDVRDGPLQMQIAQIRDGKFDKPEAVFATGEVLGLNTTNCRALVRAYGRNSDEWVGKVIELSLGAVDFQGKPTDSVIVKPISPPISPAEKVAAAKAMKASDRNDMDDEIPY
ncbi:hypothetical protein QA640_24315 [Bradyrhizobium sp. CB82]|uniref:hypothetical protein n=1 Tax=Bradyrhizobium sp. CB82 TaxID=3039159 RepID=UPI0024B07AF3|nr:hypothetical protein [Bradyrhizobium sp. CB82]WFU37595.1 hypothetical protein QA640_24315 [Bradyrhizobium sp. CB82]